MLSGESKPVQLSIGDALPAGAVNGTSRLLVKSSKSYNESTYAKIVELVENASERKAPTEKLISRIARWYTPLVVFIALIIAVIPSLIFGNPEIWIYRALVSLVISCPCALLLSVPLGYFGGIGLSSKHGILVKGADYLERLASVKYAAFDKTGTISKGKFEIQSIEPAPGFDRDRIASYAASLEIDSTHPIASAISNASEQILKVDDLKEHKGSGMEGRIQGVSILLGSRRFLENQEVKMPALTNEIFTEVCIAIDGSYSGRFLLGDSLRPELDGFLSELRKLGIHKLSLFSGDRDEVVKSASEKLGFDEYGSELLPEDKVERVEGLIQQGSTIFMGDGLNDAPVLAVSDVGIAMGSTDAALEAADMVLIHENPRDLIKAIKIARITKRTVFTNIVFALSVKSLVLVLGSLGLAEMWGAVIADVGVALLAVLYSLKVLYTQVSSSTSP
jgi:Cd2+/Zn2+-exporting ATPase